MTFTARRLFYCLLIVAFLAACSTIAPFSQAAYQQATSLKVEALSTMDKASEPYDKHKAVVEALIINLDKSYEYARGRPKNEDSSRQWKMITDPAGNSLGGFLSRWKEDSTLNPRFIEEAKMEVSDAFDAAIELESGKRKTN
jgi:hypothetical protein